MSLHVTRSLRPDRLVRLTSVSVVSAIAVSVAVAAQPAAAGDTSTGIGNAIVSGVSVSPAYAQTGLVFAMAQDMSTRQLALWASQDGGASWYRPRASGWNHGLPQVAVDASGREIALAGSSSDVVRSDDLGQTWTSVGGAGTPAASPTYKDDAAAAVAGMGNNSPDYVLHSAAASTVAGSSGVMQDHLFAFTVASPADSVHPPVLLSGNDPRTGFPEVERCSAAFACSAPPTSLAGSSSFSGPASLALSSAFSSDATVFAQSTTGIYKSVDGAGTFAPLTAAPADGAASTSFTGLVLAPGYAEHGAVHTVYASYTQAFVSQSNPHLEGGILRSRDGGATWTQLARTTPLGGGTTFLAIAPDGRLFAGYLALRAGQAGLLCSTDMGATWQARCPAVGQHAASTKATIGGAGAQAGNAAPVAAPTAALPQSGGDAAGTGAGSRPEHIGATPPHATAAAPADRSRWALVAVLVAVALGIGVVVRKRRVRGRDAGDVMR